MDFPALAGNERLKQQLSQREEGRGLSHAYLIAGPKGSGRHTLAKELAAAMVCTAPAGQRPCHKCPPCKKVLAGVHPDVNFISGGGEGKPIAVDQVRALRADAYVRPNEGQRKVYVLEGADQMNASAQNAMLKLLEEGPDYAAFLLLAENGSGVLETVRSRCEELELTPVPLNDCRSYLAARFPQKSEEEREQAALGCQGVLGRAVARLEGNDTPQWQSAVETLAEAIERGGELELFQASMALDRKDSLLPMLEALEESLGRRCVAAPDRRRLVKGMELVSTLRQAAKLNANPGQLAGWLCAGMFS